MPREEDVMEPVYQAEIATLREMLADLQNRRVVCERKVAGMTKDSQEPYRKMLRRQIDAYERRIEALTTAIEALGGAL